MDPTISGALIGAAATLLAGLPPAIVAIRSYWKKLRHAREEKVKAEADSIAIEKAADTAARMATNRLPFEIDKMRMSVKILNENGDALITRELIGFRVRPGERVSKFRTGIRTP